MKRDELVLDRELAPAPGRLVMVHRGRGFQLLRKDEAAAAGERVVMYEIDLADEGDLRAANALFSEVHYVNAHGNVWPDEREVIETHLPESGAEVLEICCGAGRVASSLVRADNKVTAIDLSEECIHYAHAIEIGAARREKRRAVTFKVADATKLPFPDRSFDIGCCFENSLGVFFSRRKQVLSELVRVCRQRVILGLRQVAGARDQVQIYASPEGFLEFAQVHSPATIKPLLEGLPATMTIQPGKPRPWGGTEWFVVLDLGTDSAAGRRNT
jgi:SAM-dependent methyltransferase